MAHNAERAQSTKQEEDVVDMWSQTDAMSKQAKRKEEYPLVQHLKNGLSHTDEAV
ncbi:MAG: hypothetical protein IJ693_01250 [Bacteroidaceae bacterium]|nr:hypothetical protein [Bacteroidaceae bacterium]